MKAEAFEAAFVNHQDPAPRSAGRCNRAAEALARLQACNLAQLSEDFQALAADLERLNKELADLERRCEALGRRMEGER